VLDEPVRSDGAVPDTQPRNEGGIVFDFDDDEPTVVYAALLGSSVYMEKEIAIKAYRDALTDERAAALSPTVSVDRIAAVMREL